MPDRVPAKVLERGRVTIPKDVRDGLDIDAGDRVWLEVEPIDDDRILDNWILGGER